jgi:signal peptidase
MTPTIPVGAIVLVRPVDPGTLRVGDIATYQKKPGIDTFITHRIIAIDRSSDPATFTFKGDANPAPDLDPVVSGQIRGQVWFDVPYLGGIRDALHGKGGVSLIVTLLLAGYAISQLSGGFSERRNRPGSFAVDRPVVVAIIDKATLASTVQPSAQEVALAWSGLLVQEDEHSATVLLTPAADDLRLCLEMVGRSRPRRLLVITAGDLSGPQLRETDVPVVPEPILKDRDDVLA